MVTANKQFKARRSRRIPDGVPSSTASTATAATANAALIALARLLGRVVAREFAGVGDGEGIGRIGAAPCNQPSNSRRRRA